ncbi:MAG: hypothetical protein KA988_06140 [Longilinea sp.]|nr:hypothetical protein [Longilinea sp.]MCA1954116.1 hypothetical protein [Anaerolinea sp.]
MSERWINAYRQAPWRTQLQWIGIFLLALIGVILTAGLYLNITAQAAAAGVEIQIMEDERETLQRQISDQRTRLAHLTSAAVMEKRALELGYERADVENAVYVVVPGYTGRQLAPLALPANSINQEQPLVLPAYRQSLWEWLFQATLRLQNNRPQRGLP